MLCFLHAKIHPILQPLLLHTWKQLLISKNWKRRNWANFASQGNIKTIPWQWNISGDLLALNALHNGKRRLLLQVILHSRSVQDENYSILHVKLMVYFMQQEMRVTWWWYNVFVKFLCPSTLYWAFVLILNPHILSSKKVHGNFTTCYPLNDSYVHILLQIS